MTAVTDAKYYLSSYTSPPEGLSVLAPRHDQNMALWRWQDSRVDLVRVWELERLSGQKHHYWPLFTASRYEQVLSELLAAEGVSIDDIVMSWGTPGFPKQAEIRLPVGAEGYPIHSLAHLYGGLLMDTKTFNEETIIGLAVDGRPDFGLDQEGRAYWYAGCVSRQGVVTHFPIESPGPIYDAATSEFGSEPGTLMALATATPTAIEFDVDASIEGLQLYGGQRIPLIDTLPFLAAVIRAAEEQLVFDELDKRFTPTEHLQSAVMKVVQTACEKVMVRNIERLLTAAGVDPGDAFLSLSGGFALNCPTNSFLLDHFGFRGLIIPPSANDSGQSLGLGLLGLLGEGGMSDATFRLGTAYHGAPISDLDSARALFAEVIESVEPFSESRFVDDICRGPIVWADGQAEIGPRALGHRSILADPRTAASKDLLNGYKNRQWWRPVAPIVLEEYTGDWFEEPGPSPYMLQTAHVLDSKRDQVPAILHLDGSARHQTLNFDTDPLLHGAIEAFRRRTGVPMICNTSLNERGEPIVDTAEQALSFAARKGIRVAYIAGHRIALRPEAQAEGPTRAGRHARRADFFANQEADRDAIWSNWLEQGYSTIALVLMSRSPELRDQDLATPEMVTQLAEVAIQRDESGTLRIADDKYVRMFGPSSRFEPDSQEGSTF